MTEAITPTLALRFGYHDHETGTTHRDVYLRPPTADDEIKADAYCKSFSFSKNEQQQNESRSETLYSIALLAQCTVRLGEILAPSVNVLRQLRRIDVMNMVRALNAFDEDEPEEGN